MEVTMAKLTDRPDMLERVTRPVGKVVAAANLRGAANNPLRREADMGEGMEVVNDIRSKYSKRKPQF